MDPPTACSMKEITFPHSDFAAQAHTDYVYSIQIVENYLVSCGKDASIRIWNVETQELIRIIEKAHAASVLSAWYDKDSDTISSAGTDASLNIWRFSTGESIRKIDKAHDESILQVGCDARYIATASKDTTVKVWDRKDYTLKWTGRKHSAAVNVVRLSNHYLVTGCGDRSVGVWGIESGQLIRIISGHEKGIASLAIVGNGRQLVTASSDETVRLWDMATGQELACLRGHDGLVRSIAVRSGEKGLEESATELDLLVSGSYDGSAILWGKTQDGQWRVRLRLNTMERVRQLAKEEDNETNGRVFSAQFDDLRIICACDTGVIVGWECPGALT